MHTLTQSPHVVTSFSSTNVVNGKAHDSDHVSDEDYARVLFGRLRSGHAVDADDTHGKRPISEVHAAASFYLAALGGPPKRKIIDALLAAADNRFGRFEYSYDDLLPLIWPASQMANDYQKKQLARDVKELMEWQNSRKIKLFSYTEGGRTRDQNTGKFTYIPTEWELYLLRRLHGIMDDAGLEPDYDTDKMAALRRVAEDAAKDDLENGKSGQKRTRHRRARPGFVQNLKSAVAYVRKCVSGKSDPVSAGLATIGELVAAVRADTGVSMELVIDHLRKLENPQVIDSVESSPWGSYPYGGQNRKFKRHSQTTSGVTTYQLWGGKES